MIIFAVVYIVLYLIVAFVMYNEVLMRWKSYPECMDPDSKPPKWWWWPLTFMPFNVIFIFFWIGMIVVLYFYDKKDKDRKYITTEAEEEMNRISNIMKDLK